MPSYWSSKDERQYEHILDSCLDRGGRSSSVCKRIAAATVNKQRASEGRTLGAWGRAQEAAYDRALDRCLRGGKSTRECDAAGGRAAAALGGLDEFEGVSTVAVFGLVSLVGVAALVVAKPAMVRLTIEITLKTPEDAAAAEEVIRSWPVLLEKLIVEGTLTQTQEREVRQALKYLDTLVVGREGTTVLYSVELPKKNVGPEQLKQVEALNGKFPGMSFEIVSVEPV